MIHKTEGSRATLTIEDYSDLLAVRMLPEFHFSDKRDVETNIAHLHAIGLSAEVDKPKWEPIHKALFDYQRWIVEMALDRERFAIFSMTGTGKTVMELE